MKRYFSKGISNNGILVVGSIIKGTRKILTVVALLGLLWSYVPWKEIQALVMDDVPFEMVLEEPFSEGEYSLKYPTTMDPDFDPSKVAIENEVYDKRTFNTKTFRKIDGTYEIAMYDDIVHYLEDGKYKQVDNSLFDNGNSEYETTANIFKLKFPKKLDENKQIKLTFDKYSIDWSVLNINSSDIYYDETEVTPSNIKELLNINQSVLYNNIQPNVDIEYIVTGSKVKENIILNQYVDNFSMTFEYKLKDLYLIENEDGNIVFVNEDNEVIFVFSELFMIDNELNDSYDIEYTLIETVNKTYEITITPSDSWMQNAVYPVVIDPSIWVNPDENPLLQDKFTYGSYSTSIANFNKIGVDSTYIYRSYIEIELSIIPDNSQITFAHLLMQMYGSSNYCNDNCTIVAKEVYDNVEFSSIIGQGLSITDDRILDYEIVNNVDTMEKNYVWDISRNFQEWIFNEDTSRIIEFSKKNESSIGNIYLQSSEFNIFTGPTLEIGYQFIAGVKDYWTYNQQPVGAAGTGYVSDLTGQLNFSRSDLSYSTDLQSLGLSFAYNLYDRNSDYGYGQGWLTNYNIEAHYDYTAHQWYTTDATGGRAYYVYDDKDFQGNTIESCDERFSELIDTSCYLAEDGSRNILVIRSEDRGEGLEVVERYLVTLEQIYYYFNSEGQLTKIRNDKTNTELNIVYLSIDTKRIDTITDSTGNYIDFVYYDVNGNEDYTDSEDYLESANLYVKPNLAHDDNPLLKVEYTYDTTSNPGSRQLESATYKTDYNNDEAYTNDYSSYYVYDSYNRMTEAESSFGSKVVYTYDISNRVSTISSFYNTAEFGNVSYTYEYRKTTITNHLEEEVYYLFDVYGHTVQVMNDDGLLQSFKYLNIFSNSAYDYSYEGNYYYLRNYRLNHQLIYKSTPEISYLNPILNSGFEGYSVNDGWIFEVDEIGGASFESDAIHYYTTSEFVIGEKSAALEYPVDDSMESHLEQTIEVDSGTYILQGYIKNNGTSDNAYLRVEGMSWDGGNSAGVPNDGEWHYVELTFGVSSDNTLITINLMNKANGTVYFDVIQVTEGFRNTRTNLFNNSSFESVLAGWTMTDNAYRDEYNVQTNDVYEDILGDYGIIIDGDEFNIHSATIDITSIVGTTKDDFYSINLWGYSEGTPYKQHSDDENENTIDQQSYFRAKVSYLDASDEEVSDPSYITFDQQIEGWQKLSTEIHIPEGTNKVIITLEYIGLGFVIFDGLTIEDSLTGTTYIKNAAGNTVQIIKGNSEITSLNHIEDMNGRPLSSTPTNINTIKNNTVIPLNDDFLPEYFENNNVRITPTYDSNGRSILEKYGDDVVFFTTSTAFDNGTFGQYKKTTTNEFGQSTSYDYDIVTGLLKSIENANGNSIVYEYYDDGLLHKVMNNDYCDEDDPTDCALTEYVYDTNNRLIKIIMESGYYYFIVYDDKGRMEEVFIKNDNTTYSNSLMSYSYYQEGTNDEYETNKIDTQFYGNGDFIKFIYDDEDRVKEVQYNDSLGDPVTRFSYEYDQRGQIAVFNTHDLLDIISTEYYTYDISGNLISIIDNEGNRIEYEYDDEGNLTKIDFDISGKNQLVNYDNNEALSIYRDILDEQTFDNHNINPANGDITPSDSEQYYSTYYTSVITNTGGADPSFGGLLEVMPSSEYVLKLNLNSTNYSVRFNIFEYSGDPSDLSNYVAIQQSSYSSATGERTYSFTTDSTTKYIIISIESYGLNEFEFSSLELDYDGLDGTSLYDKTEYTTQDSQTVIKDYEYEENALFRLDLINIKNGIFSIDQDYTYSGNTTRIFTIEYRIDANYDGVVDDTIKYKYYYDDLGNIKKVYYYLNDTLTSSELYEYDEMNQLMIEDHKDYTVSCTTVSDTCYTKIFKYDLRGNITGIKIYPYGEREITLATPPYEYSTNNGTVDIVAVVNGNTSIPVGGTLSLTFNYFYSGIIYPLDPVTITMYTTCDYTAVDTSTDGYYLLECTGKDRRGLVLDLDFGRVITVGDPNAENYPTEHIKYNYSTDWLDQLVNYETITYNTDGTINTLVTVQSYTYDDQGNPTSITNFIYNGITYDHAVLEYDGRQLTTIFIYNSSEVLVDTISYTYNDQGYRTSKIMNGVTTEYHLQGDKVLLETDGTYAIIYTYDYDGRLISFNYDSNKNDSINGVEYYYLRNQQGDITKIVDKYGVVIVEYTYDAWGNIINTVDTSGFNLSEINPYRYRGYRYDEEIAMYYLNSRFYDANVGRFINADGLLGQQGNILGHNMFAYTGNNPVNRIDESGYKWSWSKIAIVVVAGVGIVAGVVLISTGVGAAIVAGTVVSAPILIGAVVTFAIVAVVIVGTEYTYNRLGYE